MIHCHNLPHEDHDMMTQFRVGVDTPDNDPMTSAPAGPIGSGNGATVIDLSDQEEDPLAVSDGFEPVRHRLSIDYEDECIALGLSWRRDYERVGGFDEGSTISFRVSLKGLGR